MFERWYILEAGSSMFRFYDVKKDTLIHFPSCYLKEKKGEKIGKEALQEALKDPKCAHLIYPLEDGRFIHDPKPLIHHLFVLSQASEHLLRPSTLVYAPLTMGIKEKEKWQTLLLNEGVKKVRFVDLIELFEKQEGEHFIIHVGHALTEMVLVVQGKCIVSKAIPFAGKKVDENIQTIVGQKVNCLITNESAQRLKEQANQAYLKGEDRYLSCLGMNRYQNIISFQIKASDLWSAFLEVEKQIALWAKSLFESASLTAREKIAFKGIRLMGGGAHLYGLAHLLFEELQAPVVCSSSPEYDMLKEMKEYL